LAAAGTGAGAGRDADAIEATSLPKDPDRSHLADALHFLDLIRLTDEELPAASATVERSKAAAVAARIELDKHQRWLAQHQELYAQAVKGCERRLKRKALIGACKQTAWVPIQLLTTAWSGLFHAGLAYPRRRWLKAKLNDRIQELDHSSEHEVARRLQERIQAMDRRGLSSSSNGTRFPTGPLTFEEPRSPRRRVRQ
jgi:hypothetical protein